eukprot:544088-Rhodomonas_salina.2
MSGQHYHLFLPTPHACPSMLNPRALPSATLERRVKCTLIAGRAHMHANKAGKKIFESTSCCQWEVLIELRLMLLAQRWPGKVPMVYNDASRLGRLRDFLHPVDEVPRELPGLEVGPSAPPHEDRVSGGGHAVHGSRSPGVAWRGASFEAESPESDHVAVHQQLVALRAALLRNLRLALRNQRLDLSGPSHVAEAELPHQLHVPLNSLEDRVDEHSSLEKCLNNGPSSCPAAAAEFNAVTSQQNHCQRVSKGAGGERMKLEVKYPGSANFEVLVAGRQFTWAWDQQSVQLPCRLRVVRRWRGT